MSGSLTTLAQARLSYINLVAGASTIVTASSAAQTLPATNVQRNSPYNDFWQTSGTVNASLYIDFGSSVSIDDIALDGLTIRGSDTIRTRLSTIAMGGGDIYDSGIVACNVAQGYDAYSLSFAATQSARYLQFDFVATSQASISGNFRAGRVWAGPSIVPSVNVDYGFGDGWQDPSETTVAKFSGKKYSTVLPQYREVTFAFNFMSQAEGFSMKEVTRVAGNHSSVLFVPNPVSPHLLEEVIMGRLTQINPITNPRFALYAWAGKIAQDL